MAELPEQQRLTKQLGLFDVYAISTGAMFSSGFFLLPGLAAAQTGPSVVLAYFLAGLLVLPATFSQAELATAMPRAGGTYYFLDRALGPLVGTAGGIGTWLALVFKSAFALIGIGAYLEIFVDVPIKPLAIGLTLVFATINIVGAKETTGLQRGLVVGLLSVLFLFTVEGFLEVFAGGPDPIRDAFSPFMPFGVEGLFATVGLVFVSYAGLTKVASVAEEVEDPDRNVPLGMLLSLGTATVAYVAGVFIMVSVLPPAELREDLAPVATAGEAFLGWMPEPLGLLLIVGAAFAAFASTGNAGIMAASRYPLAMARDGLAPGGLAIVGRFGTPTAGILLTAGAMILFLATLDVAGVAKLASAFNLLVFAFLNLAVIIMRESRIESYVPGYNSPLYPWMQLAGTVIPFWLIIEMGWLSILFTAGMIVLALIWYFSYASRRVTRDGAIYHVFERLGRRRFEGLDTELRHILKEKGARETDPFEEVVAGALVIELPASDATFDAAAERAAGRLAEEFGLDAGRLSERFMEGPRVGVMAVSHGAALPHARLSDLEDSRLAMVRSSRGIQLEPDGDASQDEPVHAIFFLVSPRDDPAQHLHILAELARHVDAEDFVDRWLEARDEQAMKEVVLRDDRFLALRLRPDSPAAPLIGCRLRDVRLPAETLVALVHREGSTHVPRGSTVLQEGDRLTVIGKPTGIRALKERYGGG